MSWTGIRDDRVLVVTVVVDDALQRGPRVLDVVVVSPQVAVLDDRRVVGLQSRERNQSRILKGRSSHKKH